MARRPALIAPSILACDFARLADETARAKHAGADWLHVDVMDGHFVPNLTIGLPVVECLRSVTTLPLDTHLMISDAERYAERFVAAGSDRISVHVEACPHLHRTLQVIRDAGAKAGVALNPITPALLIESALPYLDHVLVMTVNPGFGGQKFIPSALETVRTIRRWVIQRGLDIDIEVDGGINADTIGAAREAGANVFVAGSAVFGANDVKHAINTLRDRIVHADSEQQECS
ncbi:MAG: ribulose-phosphate 3-epimerase [Myxococcales bacterium]|nr:ribulose-phosphate 3-epimerase [Myxococcales bacterium]